MLSEALHHGHLYSASDIDINVQIIAPKYWLLIVPDTEIFIHFNASLETDTSGLVEFFENPTVTDNGVQIPIYNNNRQSTNNTILELYRNPTVTNDGTRLMVKRIGANNPPLKIGGEAKTGVGYVLNGNMLYIVKYTTDINGAEVTFTEEHHED